MKNKSILKIVFIFAIIGLTAFLFAFSLSTCDANDDEIGFHPFPTAFLPAQIASPVLLVCASRLALELQLPESNSAILYLELHETSPPDAVG